MARDGQAEAVMLDGDGAAVAANEFLYKKAVAIVPLASDPRDDLSAEAIAACLETLRSEVAGNPEVKDVIGVRLMAVDSDVPLLAIGKGAAMLTQHRQLYRATAFAHRYTQAPLRFAVPLPALMRIFDAVRYQHLEGRLLEGIARLFGSNVRVLAYPCPREELLHAVLMLIQLEATDVLGRRSIGRASEEGCEAPNGTPWSDRNLYPLKTNACRTISERGAPSREAGSCMRREAAVEN